MKHSPIGASSYYRWKACPGSVRLSKGIESVSGAEAELGTDAHNLAAMWLKNRFCPKDRFQSLSQEDFDAVEVYVEFVLSLIGGTNEKDVQYWIEQTFHLSEDYPELYGTADFVCYSKRHEKLIVADYKHGAGLPVEVKNNLQLQYYGVGALKALGLPVKSVELIVIQPRCPHPEGPIRKWQTSPQALEKFLGELISDAKKTESKDAKLSVGDWCKFCPASSTTCPKIREHSVALASESFSPQTSYNPEKLSEVLRMLPVMEAWIKNVKNFAVAEAHAGRIPPGFKIVGKRPMRKWKEGWSGERLAQEFGLKPPEMFDQKLKSPAQVEKMVTKDLRSRVDTLVDRISSGYKLVEDEDPTPALTESEIDSFTLIEF